MTKEIFIDGENRNSVVIRRAGGNGSGYLEVASADLRNPERIATVTGRQKLEALRELIDNLLNE